MLTQMQLRNFKSWEDSGPIRLAPVTVFFGTNSSGKTSLLQALLLMKQTAESRDRRQVLDLGDDRSPISLGLISDVMHGHDLESSLEFSLSWRSPEPVSASDPDDPNASLFQASQLSFHTMIRVRDGNQYVERFSYVAGETSVTFVRKQEQTRRVPEYEVEASINGNNNYLKRILGRAWGLPEPVKCYGFPDEAFSYFQNSQFFNVLELELERQLERRMFYLGPLRRFPAREYRWQGAVPSSVGTAGGRTIETLLASDKQERIARKFRSDGRVLKWFTPIEVVQDWLRELDLAQSFSIRRIAENTDIYRVEIRKSADSARVLLPDVGFGVSQVLPVLTMLACVPRDSVVILEQPELHLHPAVQSGLADIILETARVGRAQIIVESHSEALLERIQRRIAEDDKHDGKQLKNIVALYFCRQDGSRSGIDILELNEFGQISNWPRDFFGDQMGESIAMAEAARRRASPK